MKYGKSIYTSITGGEGYLVLHFIWMRQTLGLHIDHGGCGQKVFYNVDIKY
jgi:hypothetical protein